jgi:hypothetical protein
MMRSLRQTPTLLAWPSLRDARGGLLGLPFVLAAFCPGIVLGWRACLVALTLAALASFLVYVPLTVLALNGGAALSESAPIPPLTIRAYATLFALWAATAWLGALFVPYLC